MQNRPTKPGPSGHEPLALGVREHRSPLAPASRHARKLSVLGAAALPAQPPHPLRRFLAVYTPATALPEWTELRAFALDTAEAA
jgi:hypothetical protein